MLSRGDPRTFAPDLYNAMTRLERRQIASAYEGRLLLQGQGKRYYPDDEAPESVAKRSFQSGMATSSLVLSAPFIMVCAGAISFLDAGDHNAATISIACASGTVVALVLGAWLVRLRQIRRYFETRPPADEVQAGPDGPAAHEEGSGGPDEGGLNPPGVKISAMSDMQRGRIWGLWLSVLLVWVAWSIFTFSLLVPLAMTVAAAVVSAVIGLMRGGRTRG